MTIALPSLFKLADFPQDKIDRFMKNIDYATEEEKFQLADRAWYFISQKYFMLLSVHRRQILDEVRQGKRTYNPNDFEEVKAKLIHEFAQKMEAAEDEETIEEIRKNLDAFKSKPLPQDSTKSK